MNREFFFAQDLSGNMQKVHVTRHASRGGAMPNPSSPPSTYSLSDGSPVKRIDSETFLVMDTGAYVTVVRE